MLIGLDEHPLHQITQSFAGVAGQRLRSGTTATTSACATSTATCASPPTSASTRTTTCSTASSASATRAVSTTSACPAGCGRTWTTTASDRCASRSSSRCARCASCSRTTSSASPATCCATARCCRTRIPVEVTRIDGRLLSERATYELVGVCEGWVEVAGAALRADAGDARRSSATTRGATRPAAAGRATGRRDRRGGCPASASGCCSAPTSHGGFYFSDPSGRAASGKGAILLADGSVPVTDVEHDLEFYEGGRRVRQRHVPAHRRRGRRARVLVHRPRLGVLPGRRLLRRLRRRPRPGRLPRRPPRRGRGLGRQPPDADRRRGRATRSSSTTTGPRASSACERGDETGLAHFECVVIREPDDGMTRRRASDR